METSVKCVTHIVTTVDGQSWSQHTLDSSPVGLGTVASLKTLSTEISANFTSIGTTIHTNV
jgi:hypothetical protein